VVDSIVGVTVEKETITEDNVDVSNNVVEKKTVDDAGVANEVTSVGALAVNPLEAGASSDVATGTSDCVEAPMSTEKGSPHEDVCAIVEVLRPRRDRRAFKRWERIVSLCFVYCKMLRRRRMNTSVEIDTIWYSFKGIGK
jgi:hypothetical protein